MRAEDMFGPDIHMMKGKTTRSEPPPIVEDHVEVPTEISSEHHSVVMGADFFFMDGLRFFGSVSRVMKGHTVELVDNGSADSITECIENIVGTHNSRGFKMQILCVDPEFKHMK